jgi:hypothetical protein
MEQLKLLMDYTIFHIGVYLTLGGLMVALLAKQATKQEMRCWIMCALGCFFVAGVCGGVVAASIPYYGSFSLFEQASIGPWGGSRMFPSRWWMRVEHWAFWLGVVIFLVGFFKTETWKGWESAPATDARARANGAH